jgi:hypothetical protein
MPGPTIQVLGVYALPVTKELLREQTDLLYGATLTGEARQQAERKCREQLLSTVLVEALVQDRDDRFQCSDFCQPLAEVEEGRWQVAWAEGYLSLDGESRLEARWPDPPEAKDFRVAFFIHYWEDNEPLLSSYGELRCPAIREMPERLQRLVPYEPVD